MRASPIQTDFSTGEISPLAYGRVDADRYKSGVEKMLNGYPLAQGCFTRRSGTRFVEEVKDMDRQVKLIPFEFSVEQAYVLEFGHQYVRFFAEHGQVLDPDTLDPYEIGSPYDEDELSDLRFTQSADTLYIVHPAHPPRKLLRFGHTDWVIQDLNLQDGPYQSINTSNVTLTPSAASGSAVTVTVGPTKSISNCANNGSGLVRVTATAHGYDTGRYVYIDGVNGTTEVNDVSWRIEVVDADNFDLVGSTFTNAYVSGGTVYPATSAGSLTTFFDQGLVGSPIRLEHGSTWGWGFITQVPNKNTCTVLVKSDFGGTGATTSWRVGTIMNGGGGLGSTNYPSTIDFHEDRLFMGGYELNPQRADGSRTGDYENFSPTDLDGEVPADAALSVNLNTRDVNRTEWFSTDERSLLIGATNGEWPVKASNSQDALSATNISAKKADSFGSANVAPVRVGKATLFVQRAGKKLGEITYSYDIDGYRVTDLTILAEHVTRAGIFDLAYQREPHPIVWAALDDGTLAGLTYSRDLDGLRAGWHRHVIGGVSDTAGTQAVVESIAVIPSPDTDRYDLWMVVKRSIGGYTVRYVEYMERIFDDDVEQSDAFFVDSGLTYDNPISVTGMAQATALDPFQVISVGHGLSTGNQILITGANGLLLDGESDGESLVNDRRFTVTVVDANTLTLDDLDGWGYSPYLGGAEMRKLVSTVSGLDHLDTETVQILADGVAMPEQAVSGGQIVLDVPSAVIHVGLGFVTDVKLLRHNVGAADGTAIGKKRRINWVALQLHRTLGLKIGVDFDDMQELNFRSSTDDVGGATPLFSGIFESEISADYDTENQLCFRQDQPLPMTILSVAPQVVTQDKG